MSDDAGALGGIRVVDLTTVIMGPFATQVLGDLGADVIKVESGRGDTNRYMGGGPHPELSGIALNINRNKRAIDLDLKTEAGMEAFQRLLDTADVFVTNLRPGPLGRLGLDHDTITERRPGLISCHAQGFRSDGDEGDRPAYDDIIQAATGMPRLNERTAADTTVFFPATIADKIAGQTIVTAVLAALLHRERTGRGQRVEVPMFDAVLAFNLVEHLSRAAVPGGPAGYSRIMTTTRGPHRTRDGWIALLPYTDDHWRRLFASVGREALLEDPVFLDPSLRLLEAERVYGTLAEIVAERTTAEWLALCDAEGIPVNPVPTIDEIVDDPSLHRDMLADAEHPVVGRYRSIGPGFVMDDTPLQVRRPAPLRGEHTTELLTELGYGPSEIAALIGRQASASWQAR